MAHVTAELRLPAGVAIARSWLEAAYHSGGCGCWRGRDSDGRPHAFLAMPAALTQPRLHLRLHLRCTPHLPAETMRWRRYLPEGEPPSRRSAHAAAMVDGRYLYVYGGWDGSRDLTDVARFDLHTKKWEAVPTTGAAPVPRHFHSAAFVGRRFYVFGGYDGSAWCHGMSALDVDTNVWHTVVATPNSDAAAATASNSAGGSAGSGGGDQPSRRASSSLAVVDGDKICVFGGYDGEQFLGDMWLLHTTDPVTGALAYRWERIPQPPPGSKRFWPEPRTGHSAEVYENLMFIMGGRYIGGRRNDTCVFDFDTRRWTTVATAGACFSARKTHAVGRVGTRVFLFGGHDGNRWMGDLHILDLSGIIRSAARHGSIPVPRSTLLHDLASLTQLPLGLPKHAQLGTSARHISTLRYCGPAGGCDTQAINGGGGPNLTGGDSPTTTTGNNSNSSDGTAVVTFNASSRPFWPTNTTATTSTPVPSHLPNTGHYIGTGPYNAYILPDDDAEALATGCVRGSGGDDDDAEAAAAAIIISGSAEGLDDTIMVPEAPAAAPASSAAASAAASAGSGAGAGAGAAAAARIPVRVSSSAISFALESEDESDADADEESSSDGDAAGGAGGAGGGASASAGDGDGEMLGSGHSRASASLHVPTASASSSAASSAASSAGDGSAHMGDADARGRAGSGGIASPPPPPPPPPPAQRHGATAATTADTGAGMGMGAAAADAMDDVTAETGAEGSGSGGGAGGAAAVPAEPDTGSGAHSLESYERFFRQRFGSALGSNFLAISPFLGQARPAAGGKGAEAVAADVAKHLSFAPGTAEEEEKEAATATGRVPSSSSAVAFLPSAPSFADVFFQVEGQHIGLHRCILAARCEYFRIMFSGPYVERASPVVRLPDVSLPAFTALVRYIYTDQLPSEADLQAHCFAILQQAHVWGLHRLSLLCQRHIELCCDDSNVCSVLEFADTHQVRPLRASCMRHILTRYNRVCRSEGFMRLREPLLRLVLRKRGAAQQRAADHAAAKQEEQQRQAQQALGGAGRGAHMDFDPEPVAPGRAVVPRGVGVLAAAVAAAGRATAAAAVAPADPIARGPAAPLAVALDVARAGDRVRGSAHHDADRLRQRLMQIDAAATAARAATTATAATAAATTTTTATTAAASGNAAAATDAASAAVPRDTARGSTSVLRNVNPALATRVSATGEAARRIAALSAMPSAHDHRASASASVQQQIAMDVPLRMLLAQGLQSAMPAPAAPVPNATTAAASGGSGPFGLSTGDSNAYRAPAHSSLSLSRHAQAGLSHSRRSWRPHRRTADRYTQQYSDDDDDDEKEEEEDEAAGRYSSSYPRSRGVGADRDREPDPWSPPGHAGSATRLGNKRPRSVDRQGINWNGLYDDGTLRDVRDVASMDAGAGAGTASAVSGSGNGGVGASSGSSRRRVGTGILSPASMAAALARAESGDFESSESSPPSARRVRLAAPDAAPTTATAAAAAAAPAATTASGPAAPIEPSRAITTYSARDRDRDRGRDRDRDRGREQEIGHTRSASHSRSRSRSRSHRYYEGDEDDDDDEVEDEDEVEVEGDLGSGRLSANRYGRSPAPSSASAPVPASASRAAPHNAGLGAAGWMAHTLRPSSDYLFDSEEEEEDRDTQRMIAASLAAARSMSMSSSARARPATAAAAAPVAAAPIAAVAAIAPLPAVAPTAALAGLHQQSQLLQSRTALAEALRGYRTAIQAAATTYSGADAAAADGSGAWLRNAHYDGDNDDMDTALRQLFGHSSPATGIGGGGGGGLLHRHVGGGAGSSVVQDAAAARDYLLGSTAHKRRKSGHRERGGSGGSGGVPSAAPTTPSASASASASVAAAAAADEAVADALLASAPVAPGGSSTATAASTLDLFNASF